jgi:glycosyltransferase involved in cell wall biosynthesis
MKLAVLAQLGDINRGYSVAGVIMDQLQLFVDKGLDVVLITSEHFKLPTGFPSQIEIRRLPIFTKDLTECSEFEFRKYVLDTSILLKTYLSDVLHCITHDIMFLEMYLPMNWVVREVQYLDVQWFHWIHSRPSKPQELDYPWNGRFLPMRNAKWVYLSREDIPNVAAMYGIPEGDVIIVHNLIDIANLYSLHPLTKEIIQEHNLLDQDFICCYPTRMTAAKGIDKAISLIESLNALGHKAKIIICNSFSKGVNEKELIEQYRSPNAIFTSELNSKWAKKAKKDLENGVPHKVVSDLMRLSDIFILPSISESASLIMLEAALNKCLIVMNEDLHNLREFTGVRVGLDDSERVVYVPFGSTHVARGEFSDSDSYYWAQVIINKQLLDKAIMFFKFVRKRHNPEWIWKHELAPMLGLSHA